MEPRFPPPPRTKAVLGAGFGNSRTDIPELPPSTWSAWNAPQTMAQSDHLPSRWGLVRLSHGHEVRRLDPPAASAHVLHDIGANRTAYVHQDVVAASIGLEARSPPQLGTG